MDGCRRHADQGGVPAIAGGGGGKSTGGSLVLRSFDDVYGLRIMPGKSLPSKP